MDEATLIKPRNVGYILRSVNSPEEYRLEGEMIVGREVECAIPIHSGHISRYHAKINVMRSGVYIEDLHSTNGTYINGKRIKGRVILSLGDEVAFDDIAFRVTSSQSGLEAKTLLSPIRQVNKKHDSPRPAATGEPRFEEGTPSITEEIAGPEIPKDAFDYFDELENIPPPSVAAEPPVPPAPEPENHADVVSEGDHTRMLSSSQIDQFVERNRVIHRDIQLGRGPRLIIMTAPLRGKYFEVSDEVFGNSWQIGRAPSSHIHLTDKTISADHARLSKHPEGYQLRATHAKNGILVNGLPKSSTYLQHDDKIQIGSTELVFKTDDPGLSTTPPPKDVLIDRELQLRHTLIGAAVILVVLITVLIASSH